MVCIVYSVENDESIDRITSHWLPFIRESTTVDQRKPVVLVGNKIDLVDYSTIDVRHFHILFYFILTEIVVLVVQGFSILLLLCRPQR